MLEETQSLIKQLSEIVPKYQKLKICKKHNLEQSLTCLDSSCKFFFRSFCEECVTHSHKNIPIRSLITKISGKLQKGYDKIHEKSLFLKEIQRQADINLEYCISLFKRLRKDISLSVLVKPWEQIVKETLTLFQTQTNDERFLEKLKRFGQDYEIEWQSNKDSLKEVNAAVKAIKEHESRTKSIVAFSKKALEISQSMFEGMQKQRKTKKTVQKDSKQELWLKITELKNLKIPETEVSKLTIDLKSTSTKQQQQISNIFQQCKNISLLEIKTKNFNLQQNTWSTIMCKLSHMSRLSELSLHLSGDLSFLVSLFNKNYSSLQNIDKFHLKVSDEENVQIDHVYKICDSLRVKKLQITLSRCLLVFQQIKQLIDKLVLLAKDGTLKELNLILSINKLNGKQRIMAQNYFDAKLENVVKKSIQL